MEADTEGNKPDDIYGELNALLNEITSGEPDASKASPVKEQLKTSESENAHNKELQEEEKSSIDDFVKDPMGDKVSESIDKDLFDLETSVEKEESSEKQPNVEDIELVEKVLESETEIEQLKDELECPKTPDDKTDKVLKVDDLSGTDTKVLISLECSEMLEESVLETRPVEESSDIASNEILIDASIETVPAKEISSDLSDATKEPDKEPSTLMQDAATSRKNSADGKDDETSSSQDNEASENLIDLLKKLSPEKLKEIQSKVFTDAKDQAQEDQQMDVDSSTSPGPIENAGNIEKEDNDVILIDSDDDDPPPVIPQKVISPPKRESLNSEVVSTKRKSKENIGGETKKALKRSKECINPDCPCDSEDFSECSKLILNFYYADKKMNRAQYVCMSCSDKAILKYEVSLQLIYH